MGWLKSVGVAVLAAVTTAIATAPVVGLVLEWYQVSSFEGASGFLAIALILFGLMGGFVIGLVTARVVAARAGQAKPSFVKAYGIACGITIGILLITTAGARMLADIPPTIDGDELFLQIELRWPAGGGTDPSTLAGTGYVRLGTSNGSTVRRQEDGPLFLEDGRQEDGRLVVPGAVNIFTSRGQRLVQVGIGETQFAALLVPLPGHPDAQHREWSEWLPRAKPGAPDLPDQFTYRFRVIRERDPMRVYAHGPFRIDALVSYFYEISEANGFAARSEFTINHNGTPVPGLEHAGAAAVLGGPSPALLVQVTDANGGGACRIVSEGPGGVIVKDAGQCIAPLMPHPITSDQTRFDVAKRVVLPGWVDKDSLATPGLYLIDSMVLDTRSHSSTALTYPEQPYHVSSVPPLALSPDEHSFVWLGIDGSESRPSIGVIDFTTKASYTLPIDRARMRYNTFELLDPAWVNHHFEWRPSPDGFLLAERTSFMPLPYRGQLTLGKPGDYQSYTLRPGGQALRSVVVNLLVSELGGERLPDTLNGYEQQVRVDGRTLGVAVIPTSSYVALSMEFGKGEPEFMKKVAATLDAAIASGKYDAAFVPDPPSSPQ